MLMKPADVVEDLREEVEAEKQPETAPKGRGEEAETQAAVFSRFGWSEGLLLGGVTGLGYFAAYLSDSAYKAYYGLPSLFTDVSLNAVILSASSIVLVVLILLMAPEVPVFRRYGKLVLPVLLPFSVGLVIGLRAGFQMHVSWSFLLFMFGLYTGLTALLLFLISRKQWFFAVLLFVALVISVSRASGYINAASQTEYLMTTQPEPMVVVDTYKDALVMMPFDPATKTLKGEYRFVDQKSEWGQDVRLKKVNIGPLKPAGN